MSTATYKGIAYAYPSSDSAKDFGKGETGCWMVVTFGEYGSIGEDHEAFDSRAEAEDFASKMEQPWHPIHSGK